MTIFATRTDVTGLFHASLRPLSHPAPRHVRDISALRMPRRRPLYHRAHACENGKIDRMTIFARGSR